ncbi:MAG: murein biosynthesis integral membrane protein MurJ [Pseudomonadota bacterium]|nr:murein biosynthesis integral membrane protein MurJ [Pseudomonadota bacterium]
MTRKIAVAGAIWTVALLASRLMGLVRDAAIGSVMGVGADADAYAAAFRVPDMLSNVVSGGALSIVFIPMFTSFLARGEDDRAWQAFSRVANFIVVITSVLTPIIWWFTPELVGYFVPGFDAERTALVVHLSRIMLPAQVFHLLSGLLSAALLARDKHTIPAIAPLVYNGAIIAGGLLMGSAEGFAWGVLVGAVLGPFLLPLVAAVQSGLRWRLTFSLRDADFRTYLARALPIMLAFSIVGFDDYAWTWFGSGLPEGSVSTLQYAKRLAMVPIGVFGAAAGYAAYPTLARLCAEGNTAEAWRTILRATRLTLFLAFGSQVVLTVAGPDVGAAVFGTARISPEQQIALGACLGCFSIGLGAWSAQTLLSRGFYARAKTWLPTWLGVAVLVAALPFYWLGAQLWGAPGLAVASSSAITVYAVILATLLKREIGSGPGLGDFLLRVLPAVGVGIVVGLALRPSLGAPEWTRVDALFRVIVLGGVGGTAFLAAAWGFGVAEVREIGAMVRQRLTSRKGLGR